MIKDLHKDFLLNVYTECNAHLREQSTKRDQVITFYLVLLSFFLTTYDSIVNKFSLKIVILIFILLSIISFLCLRVIIGLRSWHIQYTQCCNILNKIFTYDEEIKSNADLVDFINLHKVPTKLNFKGIENIIVMVFSFISFAPIFMFYLYLLSKIKQHYILLTILIIVIFILYEVYTFYSLNKSIKNINNQLPWIINFN